MPEPRPPMPEWLIGYLAERDAERSDRVGATLAAMTDRERLLVREVAVMAFVRGRIFGQSTPRDTPHPKDSEVVYEVVSCAQSPSMADLYPLLAAASSGDEAGHARDA